MNILQTILQTLTTSTFVRSAIALIAVATVPVYFVLRAAVTL